MIKTFWLNKEVKEESKMRYRSKSFFRLVSENKVLLMMLLPSVIYIVIFAYIPMSGLVLAFKNYRYTDGIWGSPWVGLTNFKFLFISGKLWSITRNTILYNLAFIVFFARENSPFLQRFFPRHRWGILLLT